MPATLPFDPDADCGFYAAPSPAKMPSPIAWEPCGPDANKLGWSCRQMVTNWAPPADTGDSNVNGMAGAVEAKGAVLALGRFSGSSIFTLVADADGPVRQAIVSPRKGCYLNSASVNAGKVIYSASRRGGTNGLSVVRMVAIGGNIDAVPLVLESHGDSISRGYGAGPDAYFAVPEYAMRAWSSPSTLIANVPTPSPGETAHFAFVGDAMFFNFGTLEYHRISLYTPDAGTGDFVSFGNDVTKAASDFGTDGKDMVWTEAFGRSSAQDPWAKIDIMTAAFMTNPGAVEKRRVRSETGNIGANPFVVGCGYAAHGFSSGPGVTGTRLVRLADARSWSFTSVKTDVDAGYDWVFNGPLAITCDDLFVRFHRAYQFNVARIRLDSLGPGDPAD